MKLRLILIISLFTLSFALHAERFSMRRCMLLPIVDPVKGAVGFKVFEEVENYLKDSDWCYYKSNSALIDILDNYRNNLSGHLKNPSILKILAEKTKSGSLIKIDIESNVNGLDIELKVIGENGGDIYFKRNEMVSRDNSSMISQIIKNWLEEYEKKIPYDGKVIGVLGDQFTIDIGKVSGVYTNNHLEIVRMISKKQHPLLKEIVGWDTSRMAAAKAFHVSRDQSQAAVEEYYSKNKLKIGDWVRLDTKKNVVAKRVSTFEDFEKNRFGKLGKIGLFFDFGKGSASNVTNETNIKKAKGTTLGVNVAAELWATRNFWGQLEIGRKFGTYKEDEGSLTSKSNSASIGRYVLKLGYKYLPIGFFYGPQVDIYMGYGKYSYGMDHNAADGFTDVSFKGLLFGTRGDMPILPKIRAFLDFGILISPDYSEEVTIFGEADSTSHYDIELGITYKYNNSMNVEGSFDIASNKAKYGENDERIIKYSEQSLKLGVTFVF